MATARRRPDAALNRSGRGGSSTVEQRLFAEAFGFDFFQAVRLLQRLRPDRTPVGLGGSPGKEAVRFRTRTSLSFPASSVYDVEPADASGLARDPSGGEGVTILTQNFLGLTGPSGALPRSYTELLMRMIRERRDPERYVLRDWFDLFNHRLTSLFFRAWEKYRPFLGYERVAVAGSASDSEPLTFALLCLVGLAPQALRDRLRVLGRPSARTQGRPQTLAKVDDLALVHYGGHLAHRPRSAVALEGLLRDYFGLRVEVRQFQGHWLLLDPSNQTRLGDGDSGGNNQLGYNALAGERVWDVQAKFLVRLGPLSYETFCEFLPDHSPTAERKTFFLLTHLVRLFVGPGLEYDVQLVLRADEIPICRLPGGGTEGPALGWNTWLGKGPDLGDRDDAVFEGHEVVRLDAGLAV